MTEQNEKKNVRYANVSLSDIAMLMLFFFFFKKFSLSVSPSILALILAVFNLRILYFTQGYDFLFLVCSHTTKHVFSRESLPEIKYVCVCVLV